MFWYVIGLMILSLALAGGFRPESKPRPENLSTHLPRFVWQTLDNGEKWIYDGDMPVGALFEGPDFRPISLHDLRLVPGGPVFIERGQGCGPLCISWRKHLLYKMALDEIQVDQDDPERLKLYFRMHDTGLRDDQPEEPPYQPSSVSEETWMEVTYNGELGSYVFDLRQRLRLRPGREEAMLARGSGGLEFGDLLPAGCLDRFPPNGNKRYQWYLYEAVDGQTYQRPHGLKDGPEKRDLRYAANGFLAFVAESDSNPVLHFVDGGGLRSRSEICAAMYDVHFKFLPGAERKLVEAGEPLEVHYQVYSVPGERAEAMLAEANLDPILETPLAAAPVYVSGEINRFEPSDDYKKPSDKWFWHPSGTECEWDQEFGFQSQGSLSIRREDEEGSAQWSVERAGRVYGSDPPMAERYQVRALVRTEGVTGRTRLAWSFYDEKRWGWKGRALEYSSPELQGTNDWSPVVLETTASQGAVSACLHLLQEGAGQSWFDEVEVRPLPLYGNRPAWA